MHAMFSLKGGIHGTLGSPSGSATEHILISGVFELPYSISGDGSLPSTDPSYDTRGEEADLRVWRHVTQTSKTKILVYSPDSDVYNIGLGIDLVDREVIVQINVPHSQSELFVNLKQLINALQLDPDLAAVNTEQLPRIFQMLYVCSGCDSISYFAGAGKAAFFAGFFQHAAFITGSKMVGELSSAGDVSNNYLSFLRLIGTLYFKKHYSAVVSLRSTETPQQLFNSKQSPTGAPKQQHEQWYNDIRAIVSERITNEEERMPSLTSMWRHWLRSCWIADSTKVPMSKILLPVFLTLHKVDGSMRTMTIKLIGNVQRFKIKYEVQLTF